jgi:hypothetical protein
MEEVWLRTGKFFLFFFACYLPVFFGDVPVCLPGSACFNLRVFLFASIRACVFPPFAYVVALAWG